MTTDMFTIPSVRLRSLLCCFTQYFFLQDMGDLEQVRAEVARLEAALQEAIADKHKVSVLCVVLFERLRLVR